MAKTQTSDKKHKKTKAKGAETSKKSKKALKAAKIRRQRRKGFAAFVLCLLVLSLLAFGVRFFIFEPAKVKTDAMSPRYRKGDVVIINKFMDISDIKRYDLVYASFSAASDSRLIRQVVGMEGDEIIPHEDGNKYLHLSDSTETIDLGPAEGLAGGILQRGQYLLLSLSMDDPNALDSRALGLVTDESFIGTPGKILWPPARAFK